MDDLINKKLTRLFSGYEKTADLDDLHDEIFDDVKESAKDLQQKEHLSDEEAVDKAFLQMGDLTKVIDQIGEKKGNGTFKFNFHFLSQQDSEVVYEDEFALDEIEKINLKFHSDAVKIISTDSDKLKLTQYKNPQTADDPIVQVSSQNGDLNIHLPEKKFSISIGVFISTTRLPKLLIELPNSYKGTLNSDFGSGSMLVKGIKNHAAANFTFHSGSLKISNSVFSESGCSFHSGSLSVSDSLADYFGSDFSSGTLRLNNVTAKYDIKATSGTVRLNKITGAGSVNLSSGVVRADFKKVTGDLKLTALSGMIRAVLPSQDEFAFKLSAKTGTVRLKDVFDAPVDYDIESSSATLGTVGEAKSYCLLSRVSSGTIVID
ncbi:MAG: DUF4097 family beta strand repeat-containing protein [Oenococcus sp.]|uniref:DUF4097 family beta strand repeat-containing protein n=1 Tax=Oenococcus sp. TaxID=1979414 RepID=UPI0039EAE7B7